MSLLRPRCGRPRPQGALHRRLWRSGSGSRRTSFAYEPCLAKLFFVPCSIFAGGFITWAAFITQNSIPSTIGNFLGDFFMLTGMYRSVYGRKAYADEQQEKTISAPAAAAAPVAAPAAAAPPVAAPATLRRSQPQLRQPRLLRRLQSRLLQVRRWTSWRPRG